MRLIQPARRLTLTERLVEATAASGGPDLAERPYVPPPTDWERWDALRRVGM